jgi:hypothetical protein
MDDPRTTIERAERSFPRAISEVGQIDTSRAYRRFAFTLGSLNVIISLVVDPELAPPDTGRRAEPSWLV